MRKRAETVNEAKTETHRETAEKGHKNAKGRHSEWWQLTTQRDGETIKMSNNQNE